MRRAVHGSREPTESRRLRAPWLLLTCLLLTSSASAHTLSQCVLNLREQSPGTFIATWKRVEGLRDPAAVDLILKPMFPRHCRWEPPKLACGERGLSGRLGFAGLGNVSISAWIQVQWRRGPTHTYAFSAGEPQRDVEAPTTNTRTPGMLARTFTWLGVEHIWLGIDHLLFVLGLVWLARGASTLLKTVTAFTVAHSLTLGATALGFAAVPVAPVEAMIAISIAFLSVEVVKQTRGEPPGITGRAPYWAALGFGLLHGFGFASALSELLVARSELPVSLLFFNVGVELGQLAFVAAVVFVRAVLNRLAPDLAGRATPLLHYVIGTLGSFWFFERALAW